MDIDLLAKMVKELIVEHDEVELPGMGTFIAELAPSTFSDKGYTINPPERHLCFRKKTSGSRLLSDYYVKTSGLSEKEATDEILSFISELSEVLKQKKLIILQGLGKLRATKENNFFFISDDDLDIFPEGAGLKPVSLKTHNELTSEETHIDVAGADIADKPVEPMQSEPKAGEAEPKAGGLEQAPKKGMPATAKVIIWLLIIALIFFAAVYLLGHFAPDFIDKFLYSDEELRILNY